MGFTAESALDESFVRRGPASGLFCLIGVRSSGQGDDGFIVDLKVGVIDEFAQGPAALVVGSHYLLSRDGVAYYTWGRNAAWAATDLELALASLERYGFSHLDKLADVATLKKFLADGLEHGHPIDPQANPPRGIIGRLLGRRIELGRPITKAVPSFGFPLGILCAREGDRASALKYLTTYRRGLGAPAFRDRAAAVDRRLAALSANS